MAEDSNDNSTEEKPQTDDAQSGAAPLKAEDQRVVSMERFREANERMKTAEAALQELSAAKTEREQKEALERGEHETVITSLTQERDTLKSDLEAATSYKAALQESLEKRIAAIPEAMRSLVPKFDDPVELSEWLDANQHLLNARTAPDTNAGETGDSTKSNKLSKDEMRWAKAVGIEPTRFLEEKQALSGEDE